MEMRSIQRESQEAIDSDASLASQMHPLVLPVAPLSVGEAVMAWEETVAMVSYLPARPDLNPMFLTKRVYQGSSGDVYPLPLIDRIETSPTWTARSFVPLDDLV